MGRAEHTATLLANGNVLIAGGLDGGGAPLASAEVYSPPTNRWTSVRAMTTPRLDHTATLLPSGKVLVAGGQVAPYPSSTLATTELYDPATNSWSAAAPMIGSRSRHTATLLPDRRVLVVGGYGLVLRDGGLFPTQPVDAEIYDAQADRWSATAPMVMHRLDHTATLLSDGRVLVAGGQADGIAVSSTELYDPTQDRWTAAARMTRGRSGHATTLLANGDVLVAAGLGTEPNALSIALMSAEIYDPRANRWSAVAAMTQLQAGHTATLLGNGMVLVVGTLGHSRPELYDPTHNRWAATGPAMSRYHHTATRFPDGRVLIVGGYGIESLHSVLLYDPNGAALRSPGPLDPRLIAGSVLAALLLLGGAALFFPAIRRRLKGLRPPDHGEKWIS